MGHLWVILGHLGASWAIFGSSQAILRDLGLHLGHILGPSWGHLGLSRAILEPCWAILGTSWAILGSLGAILDHLGTILIIIVVSSLSPLMPSPSPRHLDISISQYLAHRQAMRRRCECDANAMQVRCECDANATRMRCECDANAMRMRCECDANALRMRCECDANATRMRTAYFSYSSIAVPLLLVFR